MSGARLLRGRPRAKGSRGRANRQRNTHARRQSDLPGMPTACLTSLRRRRWSRTKPMSSSTCAAWLGANLRRTFLKTLRTMKASSAEWLAWCCAAGRGAAWVGANPRQGGAAQRPLNAPVHRASARRMSGVPCKLAAGLAGPDAPPAHRRHTGHA